MTNHLAGSDPSIESDPSNVFGKHQANAQIGRKSTKRTNVTSALSGSMKAALGLVGEGPTPGEWTAGGQALRG